MYDIFNSITSLQLLVLAFLAILFIQSGCDKIFNYKSNFEYFKSHFAKSILANTVGMLMPVITILEVAAGVFSVMGIFQILLVGSTQLGLIGGQLSAIAILSLFFGQRMANDYEGASTLAVYFLVSIAAIFLM